MWEEVVWLFSQSVAQAFLQYASLKPLLFVVANCIKFRMDHERLLKKSYKKLKNTNHLRIRKQICWLRWLRTPYFWILINLKWVNKKLWLPEKFFLNKIKKIFFMLLESFLANLQWFLGLMLIYRLI